MHPVITDEEHTCTNCTTTYKGKYCPQCGLSSNLSRMRLKNLLQNFLDIWGFGSRPMFRTIEQLFSRPGYMMRDYLTGHQPLFFPPFKMLVVITVLFLLLTWLFHANLSHDFTASEFIDKSFSDRALLIAGYIDKLLFWFYDHLAFAALAMQLYSVLATRIAFSRCKVKWTIVELFFAHIYMTCQYYMLECASIIFLGNDMDDARFGYIFVLISLLYQWLTYAQLYDLGFWRSLWLTILKGVLWSVLLLFSILASMVILALL